jgi:ferritin-like metal-binding protein YciE
MRFDSLQDLLVHELRDIYSAEKQLTKALPKMAKAATSPKLRKGFETHLKETLVQIERLDQIFAELDLSSRGPKCAAMEGLIEEGSEIISATGDDSVRDAALIGAAQRVEHYEIAAYGTARTFAGLLGLPKIQKLLQASLEEEAATDEKLTELAESEINVEANA